MPSTSRKILLAVSAVLKVKSERKKISRKLAN